MSIISFKKQKFNIKKTKIIKNKKISLRNKSSNSINISLVKVKKKVKEEEVYKLYNINNKVLYLIITKF